VKYEHPGRFEKGSAHTFREAITSGNAGACSSWPEKKRKTLMKRLKGGNKTKQNKTRDNT
jgi:hypothetical protein